MLPGLPVGDEKNQAFWVLLANQTADFDLF